MNTMKKIFAMTAFGAAISVSATALASGVTTEASSLPEAARTTLAGEIARARISHPETFAAVENVLGYRLEGYGKNRNPRPSVSRELRALGAPALLPMLNELAFEAPARSGATDDEWAALAVGLLDAVGILRDTRSGPVLRASFEGATTLPIAAAAARALGRVGGDAEVAALRKHVGGSDPLRLASLEGLGECRRVDCATELASVLGSASDEETAVAAARALGSIGSSWAWKALGPAMAPTAASVRATAAQALLAAFSQHGSEARAAIGKAIVMLEHPDMPARISAARVSASAPLAAEFDALGKLVAQHAVR